MFNPVIFISLNFETRIFKFLNIVNCRIFKFMKILNCRNFKFPKIGNCGNLLFWRIVNCRIFEFPQKILNKFFSIRIFFYFCYVFSSALLNLIFSGIWKSESLLISGICNFRKCNIFRNMIISKIKNFGTKHFL